MTAERVIDIGVPPLWSRGAAEAAEASLTQTAAAVWDDFGLPSRPQVVVRADPAGTPCGSVAAGAVSVDGRRVPVSARRLELAALAGGAAARRRGEEDHTPRRLLAGRLEVESTTALNVLTCLLDSTLRADAAKLVRLDSESVAPRLMASGGVGGSVGAVSEAVALAAELGVPPSHLAAAGPLAAGSAADPDALAGDLVTVALAGCPPELAVEFNVTTLRRLTTGLAAHRFAAGGPGLHRAMFLDYGVLLPAAKLTLADIPESVVRFSIGGVRTPVHLVLPESQVVLAVPPAQLPADVGARPFLDPLYGAAWSVVDLPLDDQPGVEAFDATDLIVRALRAELRTRLALWPPRAAELHLPWLSRPDDGAPHSTTDTAIRWLLAAQTTVQPRARLAEALVGAAADRVTGVTDLVARLRAMLGGAVLGPVATATAAQVVRVDAEVARAVAEGNSPDPLVARYPEITETASQVVVRCPARWRRAVERALRPLADTVVVAADEELAAVPDGVPMAASEQLT